MEPITNNQYNQCLELLQLKDDFTIDELRAQRYKLTRTHRPDYIKNDPESEARIKAINKAYDILYEVITNKATVTKNERENFVQSKDSYIEELQSMLGNPKKYSFFDKDLSQQYENIIFSLQLITFCSNDHDLKIQYSNIANEIKRFLKSFATAYLHFYNIDIHHITEPIQYNNFNELERQLENISRKYNIAPEQQRSINVAFNDLELHANTPYLKRAVEIIKKQTLERISNNKDSKSDDIIKEGKSQLEKIFESYSYILSRFKQVERFIIANNQNDPAMVQLQTLYNKYYEHFIQSSSLKNVKQNLNELEFLVKEYQKHIIAHLDPIPMTNTNEQETLMSNNSNAQQLRPSEQSNNSIYIFESVPKENFPIDCPLICQINPDNSTSLVGKKDSLTITGINKSEIITTASISKSDFSKIYIPIDAFFQKASFVGKYNSKAPDKIALYQCNDTTLCLYPYTNGLGIINMTADSLDTTLPQNISDYYKDRESIKQILISSFLTKLNTQENSKKPSL